MHRKSSASKNAATANLAASLPANAADEEEEEDAAAPSPTPPVVVDHEVGEREEVEAPIPAPFVWCPPLPPFVVDALIDAALDICAEHSFNYEVVGALAHDACISTRRVQRETYQWPLRRALRSWVALGAHGSLVCACGVVWAPFARGLVSCVFFHENTPKSIEKSKNAGCGLEFTLKGLGFLSSHAEPEGIPKPRIAAASVSFFLNSLYLCDCGLRAAGRGAAEVYWALRPGALRFEAFQTCFAWPALFSQIFLALHCALRRMAGLVFLLEFWVLAGAYQRHGVGGFIEEFFFFSQFS